MGIIYVFHVHTSNKNNIKHGTNLDNIVITIISVTANVVDAKIHTKRMCEQNKTTMTKLYLCSQYRELLPSLSIRI